MQNMDHWQERVDLAAAFRWTARLDMHEGVANQPFFVGGERGWHAIPDEPQPDAFFAHQSV